jgi:tetratricopeptide (TPR) repeat protein
MGRIDFFLGVSLLVLSFPARSPGFLLSSAVKFSTYNLTGSVFSEGGNHRIVGASVVLFDGGGARLQETTTDDSGKFSFPGLRASRYVLHVTAPGFVAVEVPVDLSLGSDQEVTVTLRSESAPAAAPGGAPTVSAHELAVPQAARDLLTSGQKKLYTDKDAHAALRDFELATRKAPNFYEAYYQAGMAYLALQNSPDAEKQFRKAVDLSQKKYGDADIALGTLLLHRNALNEGESLLREGLALNPRSWPGQFELGELELSRGHMEAALAAAHAAAQLAPQQPIVYRLLSIIELRQKDYPALISALDSYIELDPNSPAGVRAKELRAEAEKHLEASGESAVAAKK